MDALIDKALTKLFLLAEYVCVTYPFIESHLSQTTVIDEKSTLPPIHFTHEDKLAQSRMVEGELFSTLSPNSN